MPKGVSDVCIELKRDLIKLRTNLNSSEYNQDSAITKCCTVINQLLAKTYVQYLELEGVNEAAVAPSSTSVFNKIQDPLSEIRSMNNYSESRSSLQSRVSRRSRRSFKSCPSNPSSILVTNYQPPPHILPSFDTIQQADVEAASKLWDIAFATTDQNAQKQKLLLENEIEY